MTKYGYTLPHKAISTSDLVHLSVLAEEVGFNFLVVSDHYHSLGSKQGWEVLASIASATKRIQLVAIITYPNPRYHPEAIARASAAVGVLSNNRLTLGLSSKTQKTEHIINSEDNSPPEKPSMLDEAIRIIRMMYTGGYQSFQGDYFTVDDARISVLPDKEVPIFIASQTMPMTSLAATYDDVCVMEPDAGIVEAYVANGGDPGATWGQVTLRRSAEEQMAHTRPYYPDAPLYRSLINSNVTA